MTRIDLHAHVFPPAYRDLLIAPDGSPLPLPASTLDGYRQFMERYGIDAAAISTGPSGPFVADPERRNLLVRTGNEGLAEIARDEPARFAVLAALPLPDIDAAIAELTDALDRLGMDGVSLYSNHGGTYLGDRAFDPLFEELDRRGAYVFVHPFYPPQPVPLEHPVWLYEFTFGTTRAIVNLIYSGTFERYPNVKFQFAHLGGTAPFLAPRIASLADRMPNLAAEAPAGGFDYLRRLYYDTGLANHRVPLASMLEVTSADRVVFGTDWPYLVLPEGPDPAPGLAEVDAAHLEHIEHLNAKSLLPRLAAALAAASL